MDWSWMDKPKDSFEYYDGVDKFLELAFTDIPADSLLKCPCSKCTCIYKWSKEKVREHLYLDGVMKDKDFWKFHGEGVSDKTPMLDNENNSTNICDSDMREMLGDAFGLPQFPPRENIGSSGIAPPLDESSNKFFTLLREAEEPLYPGCKSFSKLSFIIRIFNIKCMGGWSNKSFNMLLKLLKEAFPEGDSLPSTFYQTKKIINELGYGYQKIDSCPNDCMLFWKENENLQHCSKCGESRWKVNGRVEDDGRKKVAKKILRHFPLIPRLQRLYMCSRSAANMRWHDENRKEDGILRHPADSACWKCLDAIDGFGLEVRNVRLGLATDGFNPFSSMNIGHSTWPIVLVPYNLPPWLCMKKPSLILSSLIPGPRGPGNDIDVYLQPLIEELQILWQGVDTYDASSRSMFSMRAALLWTINDFPAYAYMSGWSTKGRLACPTCNKNTCSMWLDASGKHCYLGHRRWLQPYHKYRSMAHRFDGKEEWAGGPTPLSGEQIIEELQDLTFIMGKKQLKKTGRQKRKRKIKLDQAILEKQTGWRKHSIFFKLPYWSSLLLRHNIDIMHTEKNVCESIVGTLLAIDGKSKDGMKARLDLQNLGIRPSLHPQDVGPRKKKLAPAMFTLSKGEKEMMYNLLKTVKVPDGYSSNISRRFDTKENKIWGLKSHDYHVIMQQLLPIAMRGVSQKALSSTIIDVSQFFLELCSKTSSADDFYHLGQRVVGVLCRLEMLFPPSFFDIMIHLMIHLANEARLAGPVYYRWMYPIERFLVRLKSYVRNKACPEGSIAEGYLAEETLTFAARYLHDDVETWLNRPMRNEDSYSSEVEEGWDIFSETTCPLGSGICIDMDAEELLQAHRYVLFNCAAITPYILKHHSLVQEKHPRLQEREIKRIHTSEFPMWLKNHVLMLQSDVSISIPSKLRWLKDGPLKTIRRYDACIVNGFRFQTENIEHRRVTQNSGVVMSATTSSFSSAKDKKPVHGVVTYYGVLKEIIQLDYYGEMRIVLFKCDWADVNRGVKEEGHFTLVNHSAKLKTTEPFVFASQVEQVWYVQDPKDSAWFVVRKTPPRWFFDMQGREIIEDDFVLEEQPTHKDDSDNGHDGDGDMGDMNARWDRDDIEGVELNE